MKLKQCFFPLGYQLMVDQVVDGRVVYDCSCGFLWFLWFSNGFFISICAVWHRPVENVLWLFGECKCLTRFFHWLRNEMWNCARWLRVSVIVLWIIAECGDVAGTGNLDTGGALTPTAKVRLAICLFSHRKKMDDKWNRHHNIDFPFPLRHCSSYTKA